MKYFIALRSQIIVMEESFQTHVLLVLKGPNVNLAIMIIIFLEMSKKNKKSVPMLVNHSQYQSN